MLSLLTLSAISILSDISAEKTPLYAGQEGLSQIEFDKLLNQLTASGLIRPLATEDTYELTRPSAAISLLDILSATGQHLNCNNEAREEMYLHYRHAANRLGVISRMTRFYLSEIKLTDF